MGEGPVWNLYGICMESVWTGSLGDVSRGFPGGAQAVYA